MFFKVLGFKGFCVFSCLSGRYEASGYFGIRIGNFVAGLRGLGWPC